MASTAALELIIDLQDNASKGIDALSVAAGGLIAGGIQKLGGAVTDFFGGMLDESKANQAGLAQLDAVMKSTGGSAGVTKDQVLALQNSLSSAGGLSTATDDAVLSGENMLLTFTGIGKDVFPQATQTMLDMATAMNNGAAPSAEALSAQAIQLGKALNDPAKGLTALQRVGVSFTNEQKAQIQGMQNAKDASDAYAAVVGELPGDLGDLLKGVTDSGKAMEIMSANGVKPLTSEQQKLFDSLVAGNGTMEAQKAILTELGKEFGGSAAAAANTFDGKMAHLGGVFDNVKQALGDKLMPILSDVMDFIGSPEVFGVISSLADGFSNLLVGGIQLAKDAFTALQPIVQGVWDAIQPGLTFIRDNAVAILTGLSVAVLGLLVPGFIAWATSAGAAAAATWAAIAPVLIAAAPFIALGAAIALVVVAVQNNFLGIGDLISGAMATVQAALEPFWNEIQPKIIAAWNAISSTVTNAWNFISGLIISGIQALMTAWDTNWGGIRTIVETAWNLISGIITVAWDIITGIINTALDLLSGNWGQAWTDIQTMLSNVWDTITNVILPNALNLIWTFLTDFLPKLIGQLGEWALAFGSWILDDVVPQLPGWLGTIAGALWTFLTETARDLGGKLFNEWLPKLWEWITGPGGVLETLPPKLGEIAGGIWTWLMQTSQDLGTKIVTEWIPKLWQWITGPGGVLEVLPAKLGEIATNIWNWVTSTAGDIVGKALAVGSGLIDGIKKGINDGWDKFVSWVTGLIQGLVGNILSFLGIHSPSTVMAEQVGAPMVQGIQQGWGEAWPAFTTEIGDKFTVLRNGLHDNIPPSWKPLGLDMTVAVAEGLTQGLPDTVSKAQAWLNQVSGGLSNIIPATWHPIGMSIAEQIAHGVSDGTGTALAAMKSLMDALWGEAEARAQQILDLLARVTRYGSATGGPGSGNNDYNGGTGGGGGGRGSGRGFAGGGLPPVGQWSLVGENGPELFMPTRRGRIIPNDALRGIGMGGGVSITGPITIHAGLGANGRDIAHDFIEELSAQLALNTRTRRGGAF